MTENTSVYMQSEAFWKKAETENLSQEAPVDESDEDKALFEGDTDKVKKLESLIAEEMGFDGVVPVSGQTYSRKIDAQVVSTLGGIAQSAMKFANDIRILHNFNEI